MNRIENLDQVIFWNIIAQGPLLIVWSHVKIPSQLRTRIDLVFMKNIVEFAFMDEIKETDKKLYSFQDDFARSFFYWWDSSPVLLKDITVLINFYATCVSNTKIKFPGKFPKYKLEATASITFSFSCIIRDVKQQFLPKTTVNVGWLIDLYSGKVP